MMDVKGVLPTVLSAVIVVGAVVLALLLGWFVVWKMFLVRFSLIRELVYGSNESDRKKTKGSDAPATPLRRSSRIRKQQEKAEKTS